VVKAEVRRASGKSVLNPRHSASLKPQGVDC
jgi:hypothetical protein